MMRWVIAAIGAASVAAGIVFYACLWVSAVADRNIKSRRIREIADQAARDRTYGDWPTPPSDFKVSHRSDDGQ